MTNPYVPPKHSPSVSQDTRIQRVQMLLVCIGLGVVAAVSVYVGDAFQWPHFNRRAGYIGTEFMGQILYAINDPYAIHIVACVWFVYASLAAALLLFARRILLLRRYDKAK